MKSLSHILFLSTLNFPVYSAFHAVSQRQAPLCRTQLCMSSSPALVPPLEIDEIEDILNQVPVYAITSLTNDSILLIEEDDKNVANFFISKEFADTVASGHDDNLRVDTYSLGKVYFQLFDPEERKKDQNITIITTNKKNVDYRLVPDTREIDQAQTILSEMAGVKDAFIAEYNEVPLFMDQHLRLATGKEESGDYKEIFPIYFGWNDLVTTCQEYVRAFADAGEEYEAAISVSELQQLVAQMKEPSPVDFRNVQFIPASSRPLDS